MGLRFRPTYIKHIYMEVWPIVLGVAGLVVSLLLGRVLQKMEGSSLPTDALLYAATVQQVFGTVVVLWGLIRLRTSFGLRRLREYPLGWLRYLRLAFWEPAPTNTCMGAGVVQARSVAAGILSHGLRAGAPLHARISRLEAELESLSRQLRDGMDKLRKRIDEQGAAHRDRLQALEQKTKEINATLKQLSVGDVAIELVGIAWLLIGTILGGIPEATLNRLLFIVGL